MMPFRLQIRQGILGDTGKAPISLTATTTDGMRKFTGSSDGVDVKHALHILIVVRVILVYRYLSMSVAELDCPKRAFARGSKNLLRESTKGQHKNQDQENEPLAEGALAKRQKRERTPDFFSELTSFFTMKEALWGRDLKGPGWARYIPDP